MAYNSYGPPRTQQQQAMTGYAQQYSYGQGGYGQTRDVEMYPMQGGYNQNSGPSASTHDILDRCRSVDAGIRELDRLITDLKMAQNSSLQESGQDPARGHRLDEITNQIFAQNRQLVEQIKQLKTTPGAGSRTTAQQVKRVEDKLTASFNGFQAAEMEYRRKFQQQLVRQYRVVNPDATDAEARSAAQNPTGGVFAQALLNADRQGEARTALSNVRNRHEAIQDVERQMVQLAEMFDQMNRVVVAQEPVVTQIAEATENVQQDVVKGVDEMGTATKLARARNRKKWWCALIVLLIIIAIAVIAALVVCVGLHQCPAK